MPKIEKLISHFIKIERKTILTNKSYKGKMSERSKESKQSRSLN